MDEEKDDEVPYRIQRRLETEVRKGNSLWPKMTARILQLQESKRLLKLLAFEFKLF